MGNNNSFHYAWTHAGTPKKNNYSKKLPNGTTIFGDKRVENTKGFHHGHSGNNFHRSPYSALGTAALGRPRSYDTHKKNTHRW